MKHSWRLVSVLLVLAAVSGGPAMAAGHGGGSGHGAWSGQGGGSSHGSWSSHGGGYGHGYYGHGHGYGYSIAFGYPLYWPGYYPGYYPYYPYGYPALEEAPPAAYIEQGAPQAAPAQRQADWFYCAGSNAYYPYVRDCPAGWQRVPSTPPR